VKEYHQSCIGVAIIYNQTKGREEQRQVNTGVPIDQDMKDEWPDRWGSGEINIDRGVEMKTDRSIDMQMRSAINTNSDTERADRLAEMREDMETRVAVDRRAVCQGIFSV